jgi:hypothetical protein
LRENWVVSLRGRLQSTLGDSDQVPYFLLPSLGSGSTLRGYRSWRFRDRHAVLAQGEWRWIPNRMALDMAFFYDAGMVAPRLDALVLRSFVQDVGVGIRFHSATRTPLRIDLAKGQRLQTELLPRTRVLSMLMTTRLLTRLACCGLLAASSVFSRGAERRFFDDDPLTREPDTQDASKVAEWENVLLIDLATNMFARPGDPTPDVRARDINTIDEVPTRTGLPIASWPGR